MHETRKEVIFRAGLFLLPTIIDMNTKQNRGGKLFALRIHMNTHTRMSIEWKWNAKNYFITTLAKKGYDANDEKKELESLEFEKKIIFAVKSLL